MSENEEEKVPSWANTPPKVAIVEKVSKGNTIDDENAPLFGTGSVSLQDAEVKAPIHYGAVPEKESDDILNDWQEHEESEDEENQVTDESEHGSTQTENEAFLTNESEKNSEPRKNCFLVFFHLIELIGIVASLCLLATQLLPFCFISLKDVGFLQLGIRTYVSFFCIGFLLVEFAAPIPFIRQSKILQNHFSRGFLYSFVGLVGIEESYAVTVKGLSEEKSSTHEYDSLHISWAPLFIEGSSWLMVVVGGIYMLLGICCCKRLKDGLHKNHQKEMERYHDEKKRKE